ncbi:MAG: hypothetical protein M1817_001072 [Caeruleum heppii]|nr:MAG: hypothetical protein M1817_001072 [Caeruleum heppii]
MSNKPIFVATHPRACSTAFERVFMTRRDTLNCIHEPFGDAFYFGPERLSERYEKDEKERLESGFSESTYKTIIDRLDKEAAEGKRLFIKDMIQYWVPPETRPASIAPSLLSLKKGVGTESETNGVNGAIANGASTNSRTATTHEIKAKDSYPYGTEPEPSNPTVIPSDVLSKFHFTFLIRHPRSSVPSYYRCTIPPLDKVTGFNEFMPNEAGYAELRRVFDYLRSVGQIGPEVATHENNERINGATNGTANGISNGGGRKDFGIQICVVDADDLLDNPSGIIEAYCKTVGIEYTPEMLTWDKPEDHQYAKETFEKWKGFHEDAIESSALRPRLHKKKTKSVHDEDAEWVEKYGPEGAKVIRSTVDQNVADYEHLKQFALKV